MIVVAIIGLLSAAALPQFLNARNRADANSRIGELAGLAKECSMFQAEADSQSTSINPPPWGVDLVRWFRSSRGHQHVNPELGHKSNCYLLGVHDVGKNDGESALPIQILSAAGE